MTVLIHALGATMGGAVRHLTSFLPALGKADQRQSYVVLVRESFPDVPTAENIRLKRIPDAAATAWGARVVADSIGLPLRLAREKVSAVVSLTNFGPIWAPVPHIVFQRNQIYYCPYYLDRIGGRLRIETALRRRLAVESMKRADLIVTPTDAMGQMIQDRCPQTRGRAFRTIYHGFSQSVMRDPLDSAPAQLLASGAGVKLLYPTHPAVHKGFEVLFDMLAALKAEGLSMCLFTTISPDDWPDGVAAYQRRIKQLNLRDNVVFLGRVPQGQMGAVYAQCSLMVYPSLCESFGFSMIEAMGYGLPIVAAGTATNREVCQSAASYYSPLDAAAGARAIIDALDPGVSERLRAGAATRLVSFDWSWARYAREFVQAVGSVV